MVDDGLEITGVAAERDEIAQGALFAGRGRVEVVEPPVADAAGVARFEVEPAWRRRAVAPHEIHEIPRVGEIAAAPEARLHVLAAVDPREALEPPDLDVAGPGPVRTPPRERGLSRLGAERLTAARRPLGEAGILLGARALSGLARWKWGVGRVPQDLDHFHRVGPVVPEVVDVLERLTRAVEEA